MYECFLGQIFVLDVDGGEDEYIKKRSMIEVQNIFLANMCLDNNTRKSLKKDDVCNEK